MKLLTKKSKFWPIVKISNLLKSILYLIFNHFGPKISQNCGKSSFKSADSLWKSREICSMGNHYHFSLTIRLRNLKMLSTYPNLSRYMAKHIKNSSYKYRHFTIVLLKNLSIKYLNPPPRSRKKPIHSLVTK
jgi:hypothetical protein